MKFAPRIVSPLPEAVPLPGDGSSQGSGQSSRRALWVGGWLTLALVGCALPVARPDRTEFYVLQPPTAAMAPSATPSSEYAWVHLRGVELPDYLNTNRLVCRETTGQIRYVGGRRWAETLSSGVARTAALSLANELGIDSVSYYPWRAGRGDAGATLEVELRFFAFEAVAEAPMAAAPAEPATDADGEGEQVAAAAGRYRLVLDAHWIAYREGTANPVASGRARLQSAPIDLGTSGGEVYARTATDLLGQLGREIAGQL